MPERPRILIIDDEHEIAQSLSIRLEAAGYDVLSATSAVAGLELARGRPPAGILLDLRMPGMDGFGFIRSLKESDATKDIPVLVLSADVVEAARARALALGVSHFIAKPFRFEKILPKLRDLVGRGEA